MAQALKTHRDSEFPLLAYTGNNLPGALLVKAIALGEMPVWAKASRGEMPQPNARSGSRFVKMNNIIGV